MFTTSTDHRTTAQLSRLVKIKIDKGERFLNYHMNGRNLEANYKTQTGFFVHIIFDEAGEEIARQYFRDWCAEFGQPINPINFKK